MGEKNKTKLYKNGIIITMDAQRRIITDGCIAVEGNSIAAVGKTSDLIRLYPDSPTYDLKGKILLPGLIDSHVHMAQAMLRGAADDLPLMQWLSERIWPLQGNYSAKEGRASAELCMLEMLKSGTTTFIEAMLASTYGFEGIASALEASGLRGVLAKIVMEPPAGSSLMHGGLIEERQASFSEAVQMHRKWHGQAANKIQVWLAPRWTGFVNPELMAEVARLMQEENFRVTMHFAQSPEEVAAIRERFNCSTVELLEQIGLVGEKLLLIHATYLSDQDVESLARTRTHLVHCPLSNMKLGMGYTRVPELLERGVNVALGCDGAPCNNNYDLFLEMRTAAIIHKGRTFDPTVLPAETVLEMATINGAKALGLEQEIGSLEVGKKADFIVIDTDQAHLTPSPNPVSTVVYAAKGSDVELVVIDGETIVEKGEVKTMDAEKILAAARESAEKIYTKAGLAGKIKPRWPVY